MAGTDSRFDASAFRDAIHFAMTMGLPNTVNERATFKWKVEREFSKHDAKGSPWDWGDTPSTEETLPDVQIPVAVELLSKGGDTLDTHFGEFDVARAIISVLDEDFVELTQNGRFADQVEMADALYDIQFVAPPVGLFEVTVYSIHAQAVDEK